MILLRKVFTDKSEDKYLIVRRRVLKDRGGNIGSTAGGLIGVGAGIMASDHFDSPAAKIAVMAGSSLTGSLGGEYIGRRIGENQLKV